MSGNTKFFERVTGNNIPQDTAVFKALVPAREQMAQQTEFLSHVAVDEIIAAIGDDVKKVVLDLQGLSHTSEHGAEALNKLSKYALNRKGLLYLVGCSEEVAAKLASYSPAGSAHFNVRKESFEDWLQRQADTRKRT